MCACPCWYAKPIPYAKPCLSGTRRVYGKRHNNAQHNRHVRAPVHRAPCTASWPLAPVLCGTALERLRRHSLHGRGMVMSDFRLNLHY